MRQGCSLSPPCSTSTSTSWQEALDRSGNIPGTLYTTPKSMPAVCGRPGSDVPHSRGSPAQPGPAEQYCEEWALDGQPGQNQIHGVPEEGQVSGKQIPVQLRRRSSGGTASATLTWASRSPASGGFSLAVKALYEKARRAFYAHQITVWPIKITN